LNDEFKLVPLPLIEWKNPIRNFTDEDVKNMATSIVIHGQIQPIICKPSDKDGVYEGVCGRLRYEGAKYAGIPEVLVRIHRFDGEDEVLEWQLAENLHRKELTDHEKLESINKLAELRMKKFPEESVVKGIAIAIEELTGEKKAEGTIKKYLSVAKRLREPVKNVLHRTKENAQKLKISHLEQISRIEDKDLQADLTEKVINEGWTVRKLKSMVDEALGVKTAPPEPVDTGLVVMF